MSQCQSQQALRGVSGPPWTIKVLSTTTVGLGGHALSPLPSSPMWEAICAPQGRGTQDSQHAHPDPSLPSTELCGFSSLYLASQSSEDSASHLSVRFRSAPVSSQPPLLWNEPKI